MFRFTTSIGRRLASLRAAAALRPIHSLSSAFAAKSVLPACDTAFAPAAVSARLLPAVLVPPRGLLAALLSPRPAVARAAPAASPPWLLFARSAGSGAATSPPPRLSRAFHSSARAGQSPDGGGWPPRGVGPPFPPPGWPPGGGGGAGPAGALALALLVALAALFFLGTVTVSLLLALWPVFLIGGVWWAATGAARRPGAPGGVAASLRAAARAARAAAGGARGGGARGGGAPAASPPPLGGIDALGGAFARAFASALAASADSSRRSHAALLACAGRALRESLAAGELPAPRGGAGGGEARVRLGPASAAMQQSVAGGGAVFPGAAAGASRTTLHVRAPVLYSRAGGEGEEELLGELELTADAEPLGGGGGGAAGAAPAPAGVGWATAAAVFRAAAEGRVRPTDAFNLRDAASAPRVGGGGSERLAFTVRRAVLRPRRAGAGEGVDLTDAWAQSAAFVSRAGDDALDSDSESESDDEDDKKKGGGPRRASRAARAPVTVDVDDYTTSEDRPGETTRERRSRLRGLRRDE